jgi:hypothetical protein
VRETYGALLATWQAAHAADPRIRQAMASIAADETCHAALAWAVARRAEARLDALARARVQRAARDGAHDLEREVSRPPAEPLVREAGLPPARVARALVRVHDRLRGPRTSLA